VDVQVAGQPLTARRCRGGSGDSRHEQGGEESQSPHRRASTGSTRAPFAGSVSSIVTRRPRGADIPAIVCRLLSRRAQIQMSDEEVAEFLEQQRTVIVATHGRDGYPHLMPLWYLVRDGRLWGWTYAKSQKARNMERDPRVTLEVEDGVEYDKLRGVMLRTEVVLHRDLEVIEGIGVGLVDRYSGTGAEFDPLRDFFRSQAPKRVGLEFVETGPRVSWDHSKLAGVY
jgi:PPOX class probable F420-dependent enzyme